MEKLNRVQRHLLSFGYPMSVIKECKTDSEYYKQEVKSYVEEKIKKNKDHNQKPF